MDYKSATLSVKSELKSVISEKDKVLKNIDEYIDIISSAHVMDNSIGVVNKTGYGGAKFSLLGYSCVISSEQLTRSPQLIFVTYISVGGKTALALHFDRTGNVSVLRGQTFSIKDVDDLRNMFEYSCTAALLKLEKGE